MGDTHVLTLVIIIGVTEETIQWPVKISLTNQSSVTKTNMHDISGADKSAWTQSIH